MKNLKKTATILDGFFRILFWAVAIAMPVACAAMAYFWYNGSSGGFNSMMLSFGGIALQGLELPMLEMNGWWVALLVLILLTAGLYLYGIRALRAIFAPMKEGRPFSPTISQNFRKLGWTALGLGILDTVSTGIAQSIVVQALQKALVGTGLSLSVKHVYDIAFLVLAGLLFLLSFVFKYGEQLQQLDDETL